MEDDQSSQACTQTQVIVYCPKESANEKKFSGCASSDSTSSGKILAVVESGRNVLAKYQERQGVSRYEQFDFMSLLSVLIQLSYHAVAAVIIMIFNVLSLLQGILYLTRFIFDKTIDISHSDSTIEKIIKLSCFTVELVIVIGIEAVLCIFMVFPACHLVANMYASVFECSDTELV